MTMMVHKLVRLTGKEAWDKLGDDGASIRPIRGDE